MIYEGVCESDCENESVYGVYVSENEHSLALAPKTWCARSTLVPWVQG